MDGKENADRAYERSFEYQIRLRELVQCGRDFLILYPLYQIFYRRICAVLSGGGRVMELAQVTGFTEQDYYNLPGLSGSVCSPAQRR